MLVSIAYKMEIKNAKLFKLYLSLLHIFDEYSWQGLSGAFAVLAPSCMNQQCVPINRQTKFG